MITKSGDYNELPLPARSVRLSYRAEDPAVEFIVPEYSTEGVKNNRQPDFRNTLYWNPAVKTGIDGMGKIEFWTSDEKSDFLITIQGISNKGQFIFEQKTFRVK